MIRALLLLLALTLAACGGGRDRVPDVPDRLYPGETAQMRLAPADHAPRIPGTSDRLRT